MSGDGSVRIENLTKEYGSITAVDDLSFEIQDGEFFTFLGPSGCGKTTTLRIIAGFESPTTGSVYIGDREMEGLPPYDRNVGMVFQSYALFPHKTVGENVGFGLKMEGVPEEERAERVGRSLEMVNLPGFEHRSPTELSGGQQQRVALARALVIEPDVLLLDEPLANLDLKLRQQMRFELQRIQDDLGITTVYVTHDQEEALSMSDRILVMKAGHEEQIDSPTNLYDGPRNRFVADFIGETNLLSGRVRTHGDGVSVELDSISQRPLAIDTPAADGLSDGDQVVLNVRPEDIQIDHDVEGMLTGQIQAKTFYGRVTTFLIDVDDEELLVDSFGRRSQAQFDIGDEIAMHWDDDDCLVLTE